jgi:hypothetical protein
MLGIREIGLPIGMKFVKLSEATASPAVAARGYAEIPQDSSEVLAPRMKVRMCTSDSHASFHYQQKKLFRLVQADLD